MNTSPCCAEYKFPATSPACNEDGFDFVSSAGQPGFVASKSHMDAEDYFAMKPPSLTHERSSLSSPRKRATRNSYGSGSISSLGSEATLAEYSRYPSQDLDMSTDTLFEHCEVEAEKCNPFAPPKASVIPVAIHSQSIKAPPVKTSPVKTQPLKTSPVNKLPAKASRNALQLSLNKPKIEGHHKSKSSMGYSTGADLMASGKNEENYPIGSTPTSANMPRFPLDRKFSLGVVEQMLNREQGDGFTLKKQLTLSSLAGTRNETVLDTIKTQQMKRLSFMPVQENLRDSIEKLSSTITYSCPEDIVNLIRQNSVQAHTGLKNLLVLDIRPLAGHVKSHIAGAINICLPSTLLKRASFDFKRCVESLPAYEKIILQNYLHYNNLNLEQQKPCGLTLGAHAANDVPAILLYDDTNVSTNIYHMCRKLVDHSCFDAAQAPPIYLIDGSFQSFVDAYPNVLASGKSEEIDISTLPMQDPLEETNWSASSATGAPSLPSIGVRGGAAGGAACSSGLSTPNVSNFSLPTNLPETKFKIRHNEEVFDFSTAPLNDDKLSTLDVSSRGMRLLPQWLRNSVSNNTRIRADFNKLEECEKSRLNSALKIKLDRQFSTPDGHMEQTPVINSGLDYGHKNRYKDIFLYEHSRVSLNDACVDLGTGVAEQSGCDYINASYLNPTNTVLENIVGTCNSADDGDGEKFARLSNYIATQGPLPKTAGDFWKCVAYQRSSVIVSLTNEFENGVEKCYAFWKSGNYLSGTNEVDVKLIDTESYGQLTLRTFTITIDNRLHHKVMQLHLDSWKDMGVAVESADVLAMIHLKNHILKHTPNLSRYPTVIHCSAGCGRTGVFAAVDILTNVFRRRGEDFEVDNDPVYEIVNDLRRQRISMVQTIRQYSSIYSLLIDGITGAKAWKSISDTNITKAFLEIE